MGYKNVLTLQWEEFNTFYRLTNRDFPYLSIAEKQDKVFELMKKRRDEKMENIDETSPYGKMERLQYSSELLLFLADMRGDLTRYYLKDELLFDFFKQTPVKPTEYELICDELPNGQLDFGIIGKTQEYAVMIKSVSRPSDKHSHYCLVTSREMSYSFVIEELDRTGKFDLTQFNFVLNFLMYLKAFPECIVDGVPNSVKKSIKGKTVGVSEKIVSHTSVERGFVMPHFRSGHFRHLNSDYFVNKKGSVVFIPATAVKGHSKTVLTAQGLPNK